MQVVGYDAGVSNLTYDPVEGVDGEVEPAALLIAEDGEVRREALEPGRELAYTLGERRCAGRIDGDRHRACDDPRAPRCEEHTDAWPCARCAGQCDLPLASCREEHAVYLAAFAPATVKVGVTRLWRLHARLREQGADRAAHLHTVSDGRIARRIEADIAESFPDRVPVATKIRGLGREVEADAWEAALADFEVIDRIDFEYGLGLDGRPMAETIATGTIRGTKGRLVVLETGGSAYAVDLRDLVGYELRVGATDRNLQSSLGAFGEG